MARKKTGSKLANPTVKGGPMLESYVLSQDGRKRSIHPGRVHADLALGRIRVARKTATIYIEGEYEGAIVYAAK